MAPTKNELIEAANQGLPIDMSDWDNISKEDQYEIYLAQKKFVYGQSTKEERDAAINAAHKARKHMLMSNPFFATLTMRLNIKLSEHIQSSLAGTDGRNLILRAKGYKRIPFGLQLGVFAHEVLHCVFAHGRRRMQKKRVLWNIACDIVVNSILRKANIPIGSLEYVKKHNLGPIYQGIDEPRFDGMDAETVYYQLLKEHKDAGANPDLMDLEEFLEEVFQKYGYIPDLEELSEDMTDDEIAQWREHLLTALQQAKIQGKCPAGVEELIECSMKPKMSWKGLVARFVQKHIARGYSWKIPNRRYVCRGTYLPSRKKVEIGKWVVAVDTSGSMSSNILSIILGEVAGFLNKGKGEVKLVGCDAECNLIGTYEPGDKFPSRIGITGRGGTDFNPVFDWVEKDSKNGQINALIYFTDAYGSYPDKKPSYPVMWVLTSEIQSGDSYYPPFGHVIHMPIEEME